MDTRNLTENAHVPAATSNLVAGMAPGERSGNVVREQPKGNVSAFVAIAGQAKAHRKDTASSLKTKHVRDHD